MKNWRVAMGAWVGIGALVLAGCGDAGEGAVAGATAASEGSASSSVAVAGDLAEVRIASDDAMRFDVDRFTVRAGQRVRLTLVHVGRLPAQTMGHNIVILQRGEDAVQFGMQAANGGNMDNAFVPEPMRDRVIAFTRMIGGGEEDTIEFTAPAPGTYPFVCSFPGHYAMMKGEMVVEE